MLFKLGIKLNFVYNICLCTFTIDCDK